MTDPKKAEDERLREVTISLPEYLLDWLETQPGTLSEKVRRLIEYAMVEQASGKVQQRGYRSDTTGRRPDEWDGWSVCRTDS